MPAFQEGSDSRGCAVHAPRTGRTYGPAWLARPVPGAALRRTTATRPPRALSEHGEARAW